MFHVPIAVVVSEKESALKYAKKRVSPEFYEDLEKSCATLIPGGARTTLMTSKDGGVAVFLWFSPNVLLSTIAHEAFHAADMVLDRKGLKLGAGSDEAWAYLIGWFMRRIAFVVYGKDSL